MSNYSQNNDFKDILNRLLAQVDDTLDKRQGSIIYDALAPAAAELAQCYIALDVYTDQTYLMTATGENLDARVADYALTRKEATPSTKIVNIYNASNQLMDVPIGTRFSAPNEYGGYVFTVTEKNSTGVFKAVCETPGTSSNSYTGYLLPLTSINNLGQVLITSTLIPGEDIESDNDLRRRAVAKLQDKPFAGNRAYYTELVNDINGVGACKLFAGWNGGGTVKIAIVTSEYEIPEASFVTYVQGVVSGIAPIGHTVTVVGTEEYTVNFALGPEYENGASRAEVNAKIRQVIHDYIADLADIWADAIPVVDPMQPTAETTYKIYIYKNKLIATLLNEVEGLANITYLTINDSSSNLTITLTASHPYFPIVGTITIDTPISGL